MNAFVTYEQEYDGVVIHRVYVGVGNTHQLLKVFNKEVSEKFGPQPELKYVELSKTVVTAPDGTLVVNRPPIIVKEVDKESEQLLNNWRATIYAAKNSRKFGEWLVEKHGWVECEYVHQEPD